MSSIKAQVVGPITESAYSFDKSKISNTTMASPSTTLATMSVQLQARIMLRPYPAIGENPNNLRLWDPQTPAHDRCGRKCHKDAGDHQLWICERNGLLTPAYTRAQRGDDTAGDGLLSVGMLVGVPKVITREQVEFAEACQVEAQRQKPRKREAGAAPSRRHARTVAAEAAFQEALERLETRMRLTPRVPVLTHLWLDFWVSDSSASPVPVESRLSAREFPPLPVAAVPLPASVPAFVNLQKAQSVWKTDRLKTASGDASVKQEDVLDFLKSRSQPKALDDASKQLSGTGSPTSLPKDEDDKHTQALQRDRVCAICTDAYQEGCRVVTLPCKHTFCKDCILPWLKQKANCPCCRTTVKHLQHSAAKKWTEKRAQALERDEVCAVCTEVYQDGECDVTLPWKHTFCEDCVLPWLNTALTCPTCRARVDPSSHAERRADAAAVEAVAARSRLELEYTHPASPTVPSR